MALLPCRSERLFNVLESGKQVGERTDRVLLSRADDFRWKKKWDKGCGKHSVSLDPKNE